MAVVIAASKRLIKKDSLRIIFWFVIFLFCIWLIIFTFASEVSNEKAIAKTIIAFAKLFFVHKDN